MPHASSLASEFDVSSMSRPFQLLISNLTGDFDVLQTCVLLVVCRMIVIVVIIGFTTENNYNDKDKLHSWNPCRCPEFHGTRIPDCKCKTADVSPLLQIRWKRLVIDEGHISASLSTVLTPFTKLLSVERRWIVSGTPTTNLLGLSLGMKTEGKHAQSNNADSDIVDSDMDISYENRDPFLSADTARSDERPLRVWTRYDREDLNKLGKMITHFVALPHFASNPKLVSTHIIEPLLDPEGPRPGAVRVLNQVMEMTMIRHR